MRFAALRQIKSVGVTISDMRSTWHGGEGYSDKKAVFIATRILLHLLRNPTYIGESDWQVINAILDERQQRCFQRYISDYPSIPGQIFIYSTSQINSFRANCARQVTLTYSEIGWLLEMVSRNFTFITAGDHECYNASNQFILLYPISVEYSELSTISVVGDEAAWIQQRASSSELVKYYILSEDAMGTLRRARHELSPDDSDYIDYSDPAPATYQYSTSTTPLLLSSKNDDCSDCCRFECCGCDCFICCPDACCPDACTIS